MDIRDTRGILETAVYDCKQIYVIEDAQFRKLCASGELDNKYYYALVGKDKDKKNGFR